MNNRGQTIMLSVFFALLIFSFGVLFMNFIMDDVTTARGVNNLDCSGPSLSDGIKLTCLITDGVVPYFILIIISAAGGRILANLTL
jgi:hypothetical protein